MQSRLFLSSFESDNEPRLPHLPSLPSFPRGERYASLRPIPHPVNEAEGMHAKQRSFNRRLESSQRGVSPYGTRF